MMRRTIAVLAGVLMLAGLAMLPSTAGAQSPPEVSPSSVVPPNRPVNPPSTRPPEVEPDEETPPQAPPEVEPDEETPAPQQPPAQPGKPATEVKGDVVSRPLPRTGNDISGTAIFGGALTVLGVALALGARKRRNSFDGA